MRLVAIVLMILGGVAHATPPPPTGKHPRMLLDDALRAAWQADAKGPGPVRGAITLCDHARDTREHDRAVYQGSEWAKVLQACLVAYAATGDDSRGKTAIKFFTALIDDLDELGDGKGGDEAAQRDSGFAIRMLGPYTALAYDWLYDKIDPAVRERARKRWAAWLTWYREKGYRARNPGTNYQAGYLLSATAIAIAQAGEGDPALWPFVADQLWGKDMAAALATGGILDGGDWAEGWQYGPLAVAEYALGARLAKRAGIPVPGIEPWLASLLRRHVYGLSPADRVFAGGDTEDEQANLEPSVLTLDAIALGDATANDKSWARGELARLRLVDANWLLYDALANVGDKPVAPPRATWPTWYQTTATGTVFARTRWDDKAVWFVAQCQHGIEADHQHPDAGNFVLSRGKDDVIVDPSPYGTQSTLTSNAPTVASGHFPANYIPSQGSWGKATGWDWTTQTKSGVVAVRCDYSDQYRFQERKSDVPEALRDLVLLPSPDGTSAAIVVLDQAKTGGSDRPMNLRFRVPNGVALDGELGSKTIGATRLAITPIERTSGKPSIGRTTLKDCFKDGTTKGRCDAARFDVADYRVELNGPTPRAAHLITATDAAGAIKPTPLTGDGVGGVQLSGMRDAVVVWPTGSADQLAYKAPRGKAVTHVILDPKHATVTAKQDGDACAISVTGGGTAPAIVTLDDKCAVTADPVSPSAASAVGTKPAPVKAPRSQRSGCCGAQTTPESPLAIGFVVVALVLRRRRSMIDTAHGEAARDIIAR